MPQITTVISTVPAGQRTFHCREVQQLLGDKQVPVVSMSSTDDSWHAIADTGAPISA